MSRCVFFLKLIETTFVSFGHLLPINCYHYYFFLLWNLPRFQICIGKGCVIQRYAYTYLLPIAVAYCYRLMVLPLHVAIAYLY